MTTTTICGDLERHESAKTSLIIIALALVAGFVCVVWLGFRRDDAAAESGLDSSQDPAFELRVIVPRVARPFAGILPDWVVAKFDGTPGVLRLDHRSRGAHIGSVGPNRVEFKADDWDFLIETGAEGRINPGTRLVFPLALGDRHVKPNCRPADPATGYLRTITRDGSDEFSGRFVVELANCKNAESGKGHRVAGRTAHYSRERRGACQTAAARRQRRRPKDAG